jgi:hypothetical protein
MGNTFKFTLEYKEYIDNIENSEKDNYIYNEKYITYGQRGKRNI